MPEFLVTSVADFSYHAFRRILIRSLCFRSFVLDAMLSDLALELCIDAALLGRSIADQQVHNSEILYKIIDCLVTIPLFSIGHAAAKKSLLENT
jgi:hypothetical protein